MRKIKITIVQTWENLFYLVFYVILGLILILLILLVDNALRGLEARYKDSETRYPSLTVYIQIWIEIMLKGLAKRLND